LTAAGIVQDNGPLPVNATHLSAVDERRNLTAKQELPDDVMFWHAVADRLPTPAALAMAYIIKHPASNLC